MALRCRSFALLMLAAILFAPRAWAAESKAFIADVRLSQGSAKDLVLEFRVHQAMDQRVLDTLESGLAVRFTYWVRVQHPRRFFPDESAVGQSITVRIGRPDYLGGVIEDRLRQIVGVVGDVKADLRRAVPPVVYTPYQQHFAEFPWLGLADTHLRKQFAVRSHGSPMGLVKSVREAVAAGVAVIT